MGEAIAEHEDLPRYVELVKAHEVESLRRALAQAQLRIGMERFVTEIVSPLTRMIGDAWARGYVEVVRNTPLLIQVYLVYFALGPLLGLDRFWAAVLALALFEGAFAAEVFRAGLDGVERGQWEAAAMLSLAPRDTYAHVVLPQAVQLVLPPLVNLAVALVKHSAIVSVIAVAELTTAGRNAVSETFLAFEIWFAVAGIYLVLITAMSAGARALEARMRRGVR